jgi:hypothetical protein
MNQEHRRVAAVGEQTEKRSSTSRGKFSDWARANKIAFAILVIATKNAERDAQCLEFTRRNLLLHNDAARTNYLEGDDIDAILLSAYVAGYDYVWVQTPGHYLRDKFGILDCLEGELEKGFFFLGYILDKGDAYFSVKQHCIFVDLRVWNEIGRPEFGRADSVAKVLHVPLRSPENIHGNHTPIWVSQSMKRREYTTQLEGWNFITTGLDRGKRVAPFSPQIRRRMDYLYPEHDVYGFKLGSCRLRATRFTEASWIIHTEELSDDIENFSGPVEVAIGVASGLKLYLILDRLGYTEQTRVHYVDVSASTLNFKRWLIDNWDGVDFLSAVERWSIQYRMVPSGISRESIRAAEEEMYLEFGGIEQFKKKWSAFRALPHTFDRIDLLTSEIEKLIALVPAGSSRSVLWLSNVFHSYYTHTLLRHADVAGMFRYLLARLKSRSPHAALICSDPHDYPIATRIIDIPSTVADPIKANHYLPLNVLRSYGREIDDRRSVNRGAL